MTVYAAGNNLSPTNLLTLCITVRMTFHRHSRWLYSQQQSSSSSSNRFVFNKTIAGRRRTLLKNDFVHNLMSNALLLITQQRQRRKNSKPRPQYVQACVIRRHVQQYVCVCVCVCVCVTMKKGGARRMASTTSDTGDTSSKQQQAQCKENYNKSKRPVSSVDHCHPYRRKKRREAVY